MKHAKKALCLLLACLILPLAGCGKKNDTSDPDELQPAAVTATPEPTPEPSPSPTPVPKVAIEDYQYFLLTNSTLAVIFKYPSHWINQPGKSTISYIEPVNPGETPARLAVTSKSMTQKPGSKELKAQLDSFLALVEAQCPDYEAGEYKDNVAIMETTGIRQRYTARDPDTNVAITGYALVCYVRSARRIYLLHFTAPTRDYDELSVVVDVIRESMSTT
ncbi:MAG: hypothetical protein J5602_09645 [Clostridia bacterium]|nr:hypothetical protein [Clostridia bacterium]